MKGVIFLAILMILLMAMSVMLITLIKLLGTEEFSCNMQSHWWNFVAILLSDTILFCQTITIANPNEWAKGPIMVEGRRGRSEDVLLKAFKGWFLGVIFFCFRGLLEAKTPLIFQLKSSVMELGIWISSFGPDCSCLKKMKCCPTLHGTENCSLYYWKL